MAKFALCKKKKGETGVSFAFANGRAVEVLLSEIPESLHVALAVHGLTQKGGDSYAGAENADEAFELLGAVLDTLKRGLWTERAPAAEREDPIELLAEAIVLQRASKGIEVSLAMVAEKLKSLAKQERAILRATPDISVELAKVKAAKAKAPSKSDADILGF